MNANDDFLLRSRNTFLINELHTALCIVLRYRYCARSVSRLIAKRGEAEARSPSVGCHVCSLVLHCTFSAPKLRARARHLTSAGQAPSSQYLLCSMSIIILQQHVRSQNAYNTRSTFGLQSLAYSVYTPAQFFDSASTAYPRQPQTNHSHWRHIVRVAKQRIASWPSIET